MGEPTAPESGRRPRNRADRVFRDPVHQLIRIRREDPYVLRLIDTPEMQRLRRIRQLGVSWITYPGAEHSRFTHSLGVFHFAQRILDALKERYGPGAEEIAELVEHERTIKAAALVHDVGHAPFSHMLERAAGGMEHEERTIKVVMEDGSDVNRVLTEEGIPPEDVASIIRGDFNSRVAIDIISSQLDADRMDYLLRDSHCTGVGYGEFDADWLIHSMCVGRIKGSDDAGPLKLCLDQQRGIYAAERFITARLHMYQQVYMHRVTRGFESLTLNLFKAAQHASLCANMP